VIGSPGHGPAARTADRGEGVVGYVVLVPVALLLVLLGVQAAVYFHEANIAENAGARAVAVSSRFGASNAAGATEGRAVARESGSVVLGLRVSGTDTVVAEVTLGVSHVVPFFPGSVTRRVAAPRERFIPEDER